MNPWPQIMDTTNEALAGVLRFIGRERAADIRDWNNLPQVYLRGRKVEKVPTSSADTTGNVAGDMNYTAGYLYICVNNGGTLAWRRVALGSW